MAEVTTLTLSEFLLARIAEDEAAAGKATYLTFPDGRPAAISYDPGVKLHIAAPMMYANSADRALAECEAKRRIVEWFSGEGYDGPFVLPEGEMVLALLALPYADHPDYDESWRP